jgi:hypothetical protein
VRTWMLSAIPITAPFKLPRSLLYSPLGGSFLWPPLPNWSLPFPASRAI